VAEEDKRVRKMAEYRALLEKRVQEAETELEGLHALLELVNTTLLEKGFKRAEIAKPAPAPPPIATEEELAPPTPSEAETVTPPVLEYEHAVPIKTATGDLLANLYISEDSMRVVLAEDKRFDVNTLPFMPFLVDRVLAKMQERDREVASTGEISPDKILSYSILRDGDVLRELTIRNVTPDRAQELKSTIRWTLEKMYEKMKAETEA